MKSDGFTQTRMGLAPLTNKSGVNDQPRIPCGRTNSRQQHKGHSFCSSGIVFHPMERVLLPIRNAVSLDELIFRLFIESSILSPAAVIGSPRRWRVPTDHKNRFLISGTFVATIDSRVEARKTPNAPKNDQNQNPNPM